MRQIALPIDALHDDGQASLIITDCNADIIRALGDQAKWPGHCAILCGPPRSGKSLMARHFGLHAGCVVIDDADGSSDERLFNAWNAAAQDGSKLLLVSHLPPGQWDISLPDLRSRLGAAQYLEIGPPDDELASHLLQKHFQDRGVAVTPEVMGFVIRRIERSYAALENFAKEANALAMARGKPVGMALAREILKA